MGKVRLRDGLPDEPVAVVIEAALAVADIAHDLVALWENQNIAGLPRAQRNKAIEATREELISAVHHWQAFQKSDQT